jgi:hypothetical protein
MNVFCIGLSKTGTSSLHLACKLLGLRSYQNPRRPLEKSRTHDVLLDVRTLAARYELREEYPHAKWIVTWRQKEDWLKSAEAWYCPSRPVRPTMRKVREEIYGAAYPKRHELERAYDQWHHVWYPAFLMDIPEGRKMFLNVCDGEGWDKLCPFLGLEDKRPRVCFPHVRPGRPLPEGVAGVYPNQGNA